MAANLLKADSPWALGSDRPGSSIVQPSSPLDSPDVLPFTQGPEVAWTPGSGKAISRNNDTPTQGIAWGQPQTSHLVHKASAGAASGLGQDGLGPAWHIPTLPATPEDLLQASAPTTPARTALGANNLAMSPPEPTGEVEPSSPWAGSHVPAPVDSSFLGGAWRPQGPAAGALEANNMRSSAHKPSLGAGMGGAWAHSNAANLGTNWGMDGAPDSLDLPSLMHGGHGGPTQGTLHQQQRHGALNSTAVPGVEDLNGDILAMLLNNPAFHQMNAQDRAALMQLTQNNLLSQQQQQQQEQQQAAQQAAQQHALTEALLRQTLQAQQLQQRPSKPQLRPPPANMGGGMDGYTQHMGHARQQHLASAPPTHQVADLLGALNRGVNPEQLLQLQMQLASEAGQQQLLDDLVFSHAQGQAQADVAHLLAQVQAQGLGGMDDNSYHTPGSMGARQHPLYTMPAQLRGVRQPTVRQEQEALLQQAAFFNAGGNTPRARQDSAAVKLPPKLVSMAAQVGIGVQSLLQLLRHPHLLDMIVRERDTLRGVPSALGTKLSSLPPGVSPVSTPRRMPHGAQAQLDSILALDPAKRGEELVKTQKLLGDIMGHTAKFLRGTQVSSLYTALTPILSLYDSMHDLPVVQKRKRCRDMAALRDETLQDRAHKETVQMLAGLRWHLYSLTQRLLLLADSNSEGVPLDLMMGCISSELLALLKPYVTQEVLEVFDSCLPNARLALLVFTEFVGVDPQPVTK